MAGGQCSVGVESTILDCTRNEPRVLRPGAITEEMIEQSLGKKQCMSRGYRKLKPPD